MNPVPTPHKFRRTYTFVVTERCNFKCRYCYVHTSDRVMSLEVGKAGVEMILADPDPERYEGVALEFIGGEPLLEAELIESIMDYFHKRTKECRHYYANNHLGNINSNGVLYGSVATQRLLATHHCIRVGLTVDGDEAMHNQNRVYHDGRGTYADVLKNVPLWLKQQRPLSKELSTKVTINHENLPLFRRGIVYLLKELDIPVVHANTIFEDVWQSGDEELFERELVQLADDLVAVGIPVERCSLFKGGIGRPYPKADGHHNWCGCGRYMTAIGPDGNLYPCNHFVPSGLAKQTAEPIGTVFTRIDPDKIAPYLNMSRDSKSPPECLTCEVATGCAWCAGVDFDETGRLDKRVTYICRMHKARIRAIEQVKSKGLLVSPVHRASL